MSKRVRIVGLNKFIGKVSRNANEVDPAVSKEIGFSGLRVEKNAKKIAPFDTGWMSNEIYSEKVSELNVEVISPADYSIYQEEGTRYMPAQPFMKPSLQKEAPILMKKLNKMFKE